jgi:putative copper resistance protein D
VTSWFEPAAKALTYAAVLGAIGATALRWLLLSRIGHALTSSVQHACERLASRALVTFAVLAMGGIALRLVAHTVAAFGLPDAWSWESIEIIGLESRWGGGWRIQAVAAVALLAAAIWTRVHARTGWPFAAFAVMAISFSLPFTGHAEGQPLRVLLHGTHVLFAGLWAGTLVVLVLVGQSPRTKSAQSNLLRAFAPVAASGVAALAATGATAVWLYVGTLSNLLTTTYGQLVLTKVGFVAGALLLGAANWRRIHRSTSREARRRLVLLEVALAVAVVIVTAVLTETAHL